MNLDQAREQILLAIHSVTTAIDDARVSRTNEDLAFADLDIDSLAAMKMCLELEAATGFEFDLGDLARHPSINRLAAFIVSRSSDNGG
jgi:acyl carrier protein